MADKNVPVEGYTDITKEYETQQKNINKHISNVELRQQELKNYIADIDSNIKFIQNLLQTEKDNEKSRMLRGAVSKNIELLTKLYSVYREYEDVKVKYVKETSSTMNFKHRLIEVDIRRIDEKLEGSDTDFMDVMKKVMDVFGGGADSTQPNKLSGKKVPLIESLQNEIVEEDKAYDL